MQKQTLSRTSAVCALLLMAMFSLQCGGYESNEIDTSDQTTSEKSQSLVEMSAFSAHHRVGAVLVSWSTRSETDCAGFNVLRSPTGLDAYVQANETLIAPMGAEGGFYEWEDSPLDVGTYDFQLEEIDNQGASSLFGPVTVSVFSTDDGADGGDTVDRGTDSGCGVANMPTAGSASPGLALLAMMLFVLRSRRGTDL